MARFKKPQKTAGNKVAQAIIPILKAHFDAVSTEPLPNTLMALVVRGEFKESEERIKAKVERLREGIKQQNPPPKKPG
jgi:hypothetical protein